MTKTGHRCFMGNKASKSISNIEKNGRLALYGPFALGHPGDKLPNITIHFRALESLFEKKHRTERLKRNERGKRNYLDATNAWRDPRVK